MADRRVIIIVESDSSSTQSAQSQPASGTQQSIPISSPPTPAERWACYEALRDVLHNA